MRQDISITIRPEQEKNRKLLDRLLREEAMRHGFPAEAGGISFVFRKKSIDARHGTVKIHLRYTAFAGERPEIQPELPVWKAADKKKSVIIIGSGPAGLFAALRLLENGIKPVIIERGRETSERKKDIARISTQGAVDENSNYCFGEGGAGTFSDGKLYTRSNKRGDIQKILRILSHFGADERILTDAHPHIGTDRLPQIINAIRQKIIALGGEFYFNTRLTDFHLEDGAITGIMTCDSRSGEERLFSADAFLLATGHSASDVYELLDRRCPQVLEAKTFAVGVRVEHPRTLIDRIQFHGKTDANLPAAEYRLTAQVDGRGVYSFCMCPGGFIVPSSSSPDGIVINGMSSAKRNSAWSNAAIVTEIRPEDVPGSGGSPLAGLRFRTALEHTAKQHGNGQSAPAQRLTDFLANKESEDFPMVSYTPGIVSSNLNEWLPPPVRDRLRQAFLAFDREMKGFITDEAVLLAIETRTSTPVRILRDKKTFECIGIQNLFPSGESSGYSGGIVSSAMDGENAAAAIAARLMP